MAHWLDTVITILTAPTANLRELAQLAGSDPANFYLGVDVRKLDLSGQDLAGINFSTEAARPNLQLEFGLAAGALFSVLDATVRKIKAASRQEERVVLLLNEIFKSRLVGRSILDHYSNDKAKSANEAVLALQSTNLWQTEVKLARIVSGRFSRSPGQRTTLTYFMHKHLNHYPDIKEWLRTKSVNRLYLYPAHWEDFIRLTQADHA